jgi:uridine phosphorylase
MEGLSHTDLILNPDGSIYHLRLLPEDIARDIILVGDPGRVKMVSGFFDQVEIRKSNREFTTHTGTYRGKRISALSTGIGTDNIDIVLNELDALVNVDLQERKLRDEHRTLRFVRLGTSGALHEDIDVGSTILARMACGFDSLLHFYKGCQEVADIAMGRAFMDHTDWPAHMSSPYFISAPGSLADIFDQSPCQSGITISSPGFYAPQVRCIRLRPFDEKLVDKIASFRQDGMRINNFEMECSALYGLSSLLGHEALTMCIAIANRISKDFLEDYKPHVEALIGSVLDQIAEND